MISRGALRLKKGIKSSELRPFSMEDPFGLGIETPSQRKLHERFHRKVDRKRTPGKTPQERAAAARPLARERRPAPAPPAPALSYPSQKASNWGCLMTLVILGILWAVGQMFVPLFIGAIQQEIVLHTGSSGYGRILKTKSTDISLNEKTVYELSVEVHAPGKPAYQVDFKQALEPAQAAQARVGAWTTLRYDEEDGEDIVLERLGIDPPSADAIASAGSPSASAPPRVKFDLSASASVSTGASPDSQPSDVPDANHPTPPPGASTPPSPSPGAATTPPGPTSLTAPSAPSLPEKPAPGPSPAPSPDPGSSPAAVPPAEAPASPAPVTIPPACRRAAACCTLAGGASCSQFVTPGKEKRECTRAFSSFSKQAASAGKTCQ